MYLSGTRSDRKTSTIYGEADDVRYMDAQRKVRRFLSYIILVVICYLPLDYTLKNLSIDFNKTLF